MDLFTASIDEGVATAFDELNNQAARCPSARFVLAGYSQGAMVMHQLLLRLTDQANTGLLGRIADTALIADGDKKRATAAVTFGTAGRAAEGVRSALSVGERDIPTKKAASTYDICNRDDPVCDFSSQTIVHWEAANAVHVRYTDDPVVARVGSLIGAHLLANAAVSTTALPDAQVGVPYSATLAGTGRAPLHWAALTALPAGLKLAAVGQITGTPISAAEGMAYVTVSVTDAARHQATGQVTILVKGADLPLPTTPPPPGCATTCGVRAWGDNGYGQFGNGTTKGSAVPVSGPGLTSVTAIAGGSVNGYALKSDGTVWAWGDNRNGQLGSGTQTNSMVPVRVSGLTGVTAIAAGSGSGYAYALKSDGTVWAWGDNSDGELGSGTQTNSTVPVRVSGLTGVTAIAAGANNGHALRSDGTVWAWGWNGSGTATTETVPVVVAGLTRVTAIAAGASTGYALLSNGTVSAWGNNEWGEIGNGTTTNSVVPVAVTGLSRVTAISGGAVDGYALLADGTVWAWGANKYGELGNGTTTNSAVPVRVSGLTGVAAISGGADSAFALRSGGTVWGWGINASGQLGNGTTTNSAVPVEVTGLTGVQAIADGGWATAYALVGH